MTSDGGYVCINGPLRGQFLASDQNVLTVPLMPHAALWEKEGEEDLPKVTFRTITYLRLPVTTGRNIGSLSRTVAYVWWTDSDPA